MSLRGYASIIIIIMFLKWLSNTFDILINIEVVDVIQQLIEDRLYAEG